MANIAATDVTYLVKKARKLHNSENHYRVNLSFGNGTLTYPAGGIPLTLSKMGFVAGIGSMIPAAQGVSGYVFSYDQPNNKLIVKRNSATPASNALVEASGDAIPAQSVDFECIGY